MLLVYELPICCILCLLVDYSGAHTTWCTKLLRNHPSDDPLFLLIWDRRMQAITVSIRAELTFGRHDITKQQHLTDNTKILI